MMKAHDVMTTRVVSVTPDTPTSAIARLLRDNAISAVPVVDAAGAPVGMVSEGDLIGREAADREARRDWWLTLLAEGEALHPEFLATLRNPGHTAREVMAGPVVTVSEETAVGEIARLLTAYRIKRVPVMRDGRIVGIVSRADLVKALADEAPAPKEAPHHQGRFASALAAIDERFHLHGGQDRTIPPAATAEPDDTRLGVADFRQMVLARDHRRAQERQAREQATAERQKLRVTELIDQHISESGWRALVHKAREAAEHGEKEMLLLRFPALLCSDGGRSINSLRPEWPETLRGEAAELYLRWEHDLKPHGFALAARVLDFPGGKPGDIGLFLVWAA